jgi:hypothetical protein
VSRVVDERQTHELVVAVRVGQDVRTCAGDADQQRGHQQTKRHLALGWAGLKVE